MCVESNPRLAILLSTKAGRFQDYLLRNADILRRSGVLHTIVIQGTPDLSKLGDMLRADHIDFYLQGGQGISRSRNEAIRRTRGDIALLSDDDMELLPDVDKTIQQAFVEHPDADIITFQYQERNGFGKHYASNKYWHTKYSLMKVSSVEIAFRTEYAVKKSLAFDEQFGLGTSLPSAEENIFLIDALKTKARILYYPKVIAIHHGKLPQESLRDSQIIKAKGALIGRVFKRSPLIACLAFALKKYPYYRRNMSFMDAMRSLWAGYKSYIEGQISGETAAGGSCE